MIFTFFAYNIFHPTLGITFDMLGHLFWFKHDDNTYRKNILHIKIDLLYIQVGLQFYRTTKNIL